MRAVAVYGCCLSISLLASGCTGDDTLRGWTGHHLDEVIKTWGLPSQETSLPDGGTRSTYSNIWDDGYGRHTCRRVFAADAQGIIRSSSSTGC
ncbi:MAG: hypothetical protein ACREJU_11795 [Nitrospiraceae bacterium]